MVRRALILAVCWLLGCVGASASLTPADGAAADALWAWAASEAPEAYGASPWIDAAEAAHRLRPWQEGYERGRTRLHVVDRARRRLRRGAP